MTDPSGPHEASEVMSLLLRSTLGRGALFQPKRYRNGLAKLRANLSVTINEDDVPRFTDCCGVEIFLRTGIQSLGGDGGAEGCGCSFSVSDGEFDGEYDGEFVMRSDRPDTLPFPPRYPRIVLCAARLCSLWYPSIAGKAEKSQI